MDIGIRALISAQTGINSLVYKGKYLHTITLRSEDDIAILQIPLLLNRTIDTIEEFVSIFSIIPKDQMPYYPCVGSGFGIYIVGEEMHLVTDYSSAEIAEHVFIPTIINDMVF